jgi:hypothetical protein
MRDCIIYSRSGILIHVCGVGEKRACATSADILEFRLGGVHARIGSARSLRSTLINYSKQPSLRGCIGKQMRTIDLNPTSLQPAGVRFPMHICEVRPCKDRRGFDLISDVLPFGGLWYTKPHDAVSYAKFFSRSHHVVIRVYDGSGDVIETHEHSGSRPQWDARRFNARSFTVWFGLSCVTRQDRVIVEILSDADAPIAFVG